MKVYVIGAHACGKSTLARYISEKHGLTFLPEAARMVLSEQELQLDTLRYNLDVVDAYQQAVFDRQIIEENKCDTFVSDRCLLDVLAYSAMHARIVSKLAVSSALKNYVSNMQTNGSIIFFVRPAKATLKQDGTRETLSWDAIVAIDAMIKLLLEMHGLTYFQIDTESMQERVKLIDSVLALA